MGPSPLIRLTRTEYDNTVRDLLGDDSNLASSFSADEQLGFFASNAVAPIGTLTFEQYRDAAEQLAENARSRIDELSSCDPVAEGDATCLTELVTQFGRRAYRRPLSEQEVEAFIALTNSEDAELGWSAASLEYDERAALVIETMLQSPNFLYRVELSTAPVGKVVPVTSFEMASRLSYFLWKSMPDDTLLEAAEADALAEPEQLKEQAQRMMQDDRFSRSLESFVTQWLGLTQFSEAVDDLDTSPPFDAALRSSMVAETTLFFEDVVRQGDARMPTLFTSTSSFIDDRLAPLYGLSPSGNSGPVRRELDPTQRSGLLTHASVLAAHSHPAHIQRGILVRERMLCQPLPPPPDDVPAAPQPVPGQSTRERFEQHVADPVCASCHGAIDPIGFGFEAYDAIGRHRTVDNGAPVDDHGEFADTNIPDTAFQGAVELSGLLASHPDVTRCMSQLWLEFALGRPTTNGEPAVIDELALGFADSGLDIRELILAVVQSKAFRYRRAD
jgi:hypothetical protein